METAQQTKPGVSCVFEDHIASVVIDRPPVNALSDDTYQALLDVFTGFRSNPDVRVVLLSSAGTRAFCAGTDVNFFGLRHPEDPDWHERHSKLVRDTFEAIIRCAVPVIAVVDGVCVGGGMGLICLCDIVYASETASFGLPEINVGVLGGPRHARRLIPEGWTRLMAFTGERLSAQEFKEAGGAQKVVPAAELWGAAWDLATLIASKNPVGMRVLKQGLNHVEIGQLNLIEGYFYEQGLTGSIVDHPYSKEAAQAFFEKRQPRFE